MLLTKEELKKVRKAWQRLTMEERQEIRRTLDLMDQRPAPGDELHHNPLTVALLGDVHE